MGVRPDELLQALYSDLEPYVETTLGGHMQMAQDPYHPLELLFEGPARFRVILVYDGDEPLHAHPRVSFVKVNFHLVVGHLMGLASEPGKYLFVNRAGDKPLLELLSLVRDRVRTHVFPADDQTERHIKYEGAEPLTLPDGLNLAAYRIKFSLKATMPIVQYRS